MQSWKLKKKRFSNRGGEQNSEEEQPPADSEEERLLKEAAGIDDSNAEDWGVCGADLTWYYANNILLIRGTGDMSGSPWKENHTEDIIRVIIEDGCTSISDNAFGAGYNIKCLPNLSKVRLPDTLITIGDYAFNGCENLTDIEIPDSVTTIGNSAFWGCEKLAGMSIPDSVTKIGDDALNYEREVPEPAHWTP